MDLELLKAANAGNIDAFCKLIDPERSAQASIDHASININHQPAFCSCLCYCFHFKCTSSRRSDEQANQIMQSLAKSTSSTDIGQPTDDNTINLVANTCPLIWQVTADGSGVLHIAASFGDVKPVEAILTPQQNRGIAAALLRAKNNRGDRPLHQAASTGSRETTERIVEKAKEIMGESDANFVWFLRARNLDGQTCLHEAVRLGHKDVVEYLAQEDARLGVERPSREVAQPLVQSVDNEGISPLYLATTLLKEEIINALLLESVASMISPSYSGPAGKTALHAAVPLSKELSSILVNWKPSLIRIPDESGSTPLHYLADGKYTDKPSCISITELLLSKDPSSGYCEDSKGSLPIHVAAAYNTVGVIDQFVKMCPGCELSCNASGQTILHVAVQRGSYDIVGLVCSEVRFKMILNTKDNDGNTALHLAVQKGCHKTFGFLIGNRDVSTSIRNKNGYTPLDHAVLNKTSRWTYATYWPIFHKNLNNDPRRIWIFHVKWSYFLPMTISACRATSGGFATVCSPFFSAFDAALWGLMAWKIVRHVRPLWARCGCRGLAGAVLNRRRAPCHSTVPLLHVLIPVSDAGEWTLYAFNMCDKKLSILDSRRDASEGGDQDPARCHEETRKAMCAALDKTMDVDFSFLSWDYNFPKVPRQQNTSLFGEMI
uniref:Uncharacterized protein n=1 Tax=Oryza brachyantha TaxID=4533 RepID=J3MW88_ORYBR